MGPCSSILTQDLTREALEGQRSVVIPSGQILPFKFGGTVLFFSVASEILPHIFGPLAESDPFPGFACDTQYSMAPMCLGLKSG